MKHLEKHFAAAAVILVFFFALALRLYKLGQYPNGLLWDEAALGYNAYSILKTARDEYGEFLPVIFKSFGDYKPGVYVYLAIPGIALLGLNEFAVRLPSAFFGALTVPFLYLLLRQSFAREESPAKKSSPFWRALIPSLLLAVSPWHLGFSRGAWELNVMVFEVVAGFSFLIGFLNRRGNWRLYSAAFLFLLSFFTYQSAKLLVPVLLLGFVFFFRERLKILSFRPKIGFTAIIAAGFIFLNLGTVLGNKASRLKVMSIFSYPRSPQETQMIKSQDRGNGTSWSLFHQSPVFFFRSVLGRYLNHFSGKFLFFSGDWSNPRNGIAYQGVLYCADAFFLLWGLGVIFSRKRSSLENLMLFWLVLAPLPAALTRDIISSVRSFSLVIPLVFLIGTGLTDFLSFFSRRGKVLQAASTLAVSLTYGFLFVRLLDNYFVHDPIINAKDRLYGYRTMIKAVQTLAAGKDKVVITSKYGQPYIFYLFYTAYDPAKYQKSAKLKENPYGDVGEVERIDNIEFRPVYWPTDRGVANSLFVDDEFGLPAGDLVSPKDEFIIDGEIKYPDGKLAFRIVETK